ncbi:MAG: ARMT1-like domain-containing protein [Desulfocapsa sp.]|nr:ARMT1-like domain-containing protein [Desulfocapsa sp.]
MKTAIDCLPCYMRQTLQVVRLSTDDPELQLEVLRRVAELTRDMDMDRTPPENSVPVYQAIAEISGCADPYFEIKKQSNEQALALLPKIQKELSHSSNPLAVVLRLAIGGNIIDYGAMHSFDVDATMERCLKVPFAIDHSRELQRQVEALRKGASVLYLADNSGEIVYDSLLVNLLTDLGLKVAVAVKSGPIINDALLADAKACGLDRVARILENGTSCPGTPLAICSDELKQAFTEADLILSKGQGNFETLSEEKAEIFFLLTVKCSVVGAHLAEISSIQQQELPGKGELVLFHYNGNS